MAKKGIIHIIQSLDSGGCENMLLRTLPFVSNFDHKIITLKNRGELANKFEEKNISVTNIGQKNILDIPAYWKLLKEIRRINPDLTITYLFHADAIGRLFLQILTKAKVIPFLRTTYNHPKYRFARFFEKVTKYFVENYLANSEAVKNFYVENIGVKKEKITVIPNGIDILFYDSIPRNENFRKKLGIDPEETAIACVANLHVNKGHKYLLEAFEKVYQSNHKIRLLIVGDGEEKENLQKQIENYESKDNILFLGKRSDVSQLLKISDIFVLPTLFEGMSNAIMEAMACGLPIITTEIPENRQLIKHEENGFLCKQQDAKNLKDKINSLVTNEVLKNRFENNSRKAIKDNYSMKITTTKWTAFLNEKIKI